MPRTGRKPIDNEARTHKMWIRETPTNVERLKAVAREGESPGQAMRRLARQMLDLLDAGGRGA